MDCVLVILYCLKISNAIQIYLKYLQTTTMRVSEKCWIVLGRDLKLICLGFQYLNSVAKLPRTFWIHLKTILHYLNIVTESFDVI